MNTATTYATRAASLTAKAVSSIVLLMLSLWVVGVNAGDSAPAYSAQDEFEAALSELVADAAHAASLAASARNVIDNVSPGTEVSLRSMHRALERNADEPTAAFEAMATAYIVLTTIADEVNYHQDTRIRLVSVMESVERVAGQ